jgi:hypothetical protein
MPNNSTRFQLTEWEMSFLRFLFFFARIFVFVAVRKELGRLAPRRLKGCVAEFSGYRRNIPLLFGDKSLEQFVFDLFILNRALNQTRSVCLRAF